MKKDANRKNKGNKKNRKIIIISLIVLAIVIVAVASLNKTILGNFLGLGKKQSSGSEVQVIPLSYENIEGVLSRSSMIIDLPEKSTILLRFYNFNSGQRQWEKSYIITPGSVKEGYLENEDITLTLDSGYLQGLTTGNFCSAIQQAKTNGDLGVYTELSTASLLWKFKSMTKYRECLGF